ncbi:MAG: hypothetical protein U1E99_05880 [Agitococcus sp.]
MNDGILKEAFVHDEVQCHGRSSVESLLQTGSGNDFIDNTANYTSDEIRTGASNDTLNGGLGADTLIGGTGNDLASLITSTTKL